MTEHNAEKDEPRFHVGQTVWMSNWRYRREPQAVVVTKVARKYVTVAVNSREEKFDLSTGQAPGESGWFIETDADRTEKKARASAVERLREVGFRDTTDFPRGLTTDALLRIAEVVATDLSLPPVSEEAHD